MQEEIWLKSLLSCFVNTMATTPSSSLNYVVQLVNIAKVNQSKFLAYNDEQD